MQYCGAAKCEVNTENLLPCKCSETNHLSSTNIAPVVLQRGSRGRPFHGGLSPLAAGTEVGCKMGLQRTYRTLPPLSLLLASLAPLCASCFFTSLVVASNNLFDATAVPPPELQTRLTV